MSIGPVSSWLTWTGDRWAAHFTKTIGCSDGTATLELSDWALRVRPGIISAVEHDTTTGSCPKSTSVVRWIAHPALRSPGTGSI